MADQRTLVFLKPDAVVRRYCGARVLESLTEDASVAFFAEADPDREFIAGEHYPQHEGRFFYDWLVEFVDAAPLLVTILEGEDVISTVRERLGDTVSHEADPDTLRGRYGTFGGINVAHASDSPENAETEIERWQPVVEAADVGDDHEARAEAYVERYLDAPMVDTLRYREVSRRFADGDLDAERAHDRFLHLLSKETDAAFEHVSALADAMVENVRLEER